MKVIRFHWYSSISSILFVPLGTFVGDTGLKLFLGETKRLLENFEATPGYEP